MLGPLLFIVYINDIPEVVQSNIAIFANDTKSGAAEIGGQWPPLNLRPLHRIVFFAIENQFSLVKQPPLLLVASSAPAPSYIYLSISLIIVVPYNLILICWWSAVGSGKSNLIL